MLLGGNIKHCALSEAWLPSSRRGQTGSQGSDSNTAKTACARGRPGGQRRGRGGGGAAPVSSRIGPRAASAPAPHWPSACGAGPPPAPRSSSGPEPAEPAESQPREGPGRVRCPPPRRVPRSWVLSARAAGGLSVRERPGPIQWPLSAGPFVQGAATSCGAGLGQEGGNSPSRGPDDEAAPAWGQRRWPPTWGALGLGFRARGGSEAGLSSALSSGRQPSAEWASEQCVPSLGGHGGDPVELGRAAGGGRSLSLGVPLPACPLPLNPSRG